jgi:mitofusin
MNTSAVLPDNPFPFADFDRNVTGTGGPMRIHFTEMEGRSRLGANGSVSEVSAKVVIGDDNSWGHNWWEFMVHGVHYPASGGAVLTTTSER